MSRNILLVHGAFSHAGHLESWARVFAAAGYGCMVPTLPGHDPRDVAALPHCTLDAYRFQLRERALALPERPILIGHSMGGLLVQQLAATIPCAALVCVASAPPWLLTAQLRALPHFLPLLPAILAGRPFRPSAKALRTLALHDLPEADQDRLEPGFVAESGLAYRAMILGTARLPGPRFTGPTLCVSGGGDRIISRRTSRRIAELYSAQHFVYPEQGHWLIAHDAIAERIVTWLTELEAARGFEPRA